VEDKMFIKVMKHRSLPTGKGEGGLGRNKVEKDAKWYAVQVSDTTMLSNAKSL
jgi:hypothetical protein